MLNIKSINIAIVPTWDKVRTILNQTQDFLEGKDPALISATTMSVTELIENALKYGTLTPDGKDIIFNLNVDEKMIRIEVINGVRSQHDVEHVKNIVNHINSSDDPEQLYIQRLKELIENPKFGVSQLGLYRISYEGQFDIDYQFENGVLTIKAVRAIETQQGMGLSTPSHQR
jgi:hypothetical protein